jgi:hypothetical protein
MGSAFNQQWTVEKFKNQDIYYQICLNLFMSPNQFFFYYSRPYDLFTSNEPTYPKQVLQ